MKIDEKHFHLCKIFVDETEVPLNGSTCFVYGALLMPIDCDISERLGNTRKAVPYVNKLRFSEYSRHHDKKEQIFKGFLDDFLASSACFRAILVSPDTWSNIESPESRAQLAAVLLAYPWIPCEGVLYKNLSRPRVIFDRHSLNEAQEDQFKAKIKRTLEKGANVPGSRSKPIADPAVVFADTRAFDELQLIDELLGIVRCSYLEKAGESIRKHKKDIHDYLLERFSDIETFVEVNRNHTGQKMDVWHFEPKQNTN